MQPLNMKQTIAGTLAQLTERITAAIKKEGFGVLTRIDLHDKFKEKLGKDVAPVVILGACNPQLAYEAYEQNPDVACLLPCNVVLRELAAGQISVEIAKPSSMMSFLGDARMAAMAEQADEALRRALQSIAT